jgi:DNA-binding NtrC family response regulator
LHDDDSITLSPSTLERVRQASGPRTSLVLYYGERVEVLPLAPDAPIVIGRSAPADVVVREPNLSRQHARFTLVAEGVRVEDLGSTNGTELRGSKIESAVLLPGESVTCGTLVASIHRTGGKVSLSDGLEPYDRFFARVEDELVRSRTFLRRVAVLMVRARDEDIHVSSFVPAIAELLRPVDRIALYGTHAVLVLLPETDQERASRLAHAIAAADARLFVGVGIEGMYAEELIDSARTLARRAGPEERVLIESDDVPASTSRPLFVSPKMRELAELLERVARAKIPVLLQGETGSGKEVIARSIHGWGPRAEAPMRAVNCAAIPTNLIESTLFGHEKGAFTGADRASPGLFEQANGGTLFLDEVGELPPAAQAALLRVLESQSIVRVGGQKEIPVDVRVIAATNRDLESMVSAGSFRSDLLFRLNSMTLHVPPLRERPEDLDPLIDRFLESAARETGARVHTMTAEARALLRGYAWPGNVRELRNVVERAIVVCRGDSIDVSDLPDRMRAPAQLPDDEETIIGADTDFKDRVRAYETQLILDALKRSDGNQSSAAKLLRMPLRTLTHKMKVYGIKKQFDTDD